MASITSYIRFALGILLSLEIFRAAFMGQGITLTAMAISVLILALSATYLMGISG